MTVTKITALNHPPYTTLNVRPKLYILALRIQHLIKKIKMEARTMDNAVSLSQ